MTETESTKKKTIAPVKETEATVKEPLEIEWETRMQFVEGSKWWEIIEIDGEEMLCICTARTESKRFTMSEANRLTEEYQKSQPA